MQGGARGLARVPSLAGGPALSSALLRPVWDPPALHAERGLEVTLQTPRHPQALSMLQEKVDGWDMAGKRTKVFHMVTAGQSPSGGQSVINGWFVCVDR